MRVTKCIAILFASIFSLSIVAQPINDDCSGALNVLVDDGNCISANTNVNFQNTSFSGVSICQGSSTYTDLWYEFTLPSDRNLIQIEYNSSFYFNAILYSSNCGSLVEESCFTFSLGYEIIHDLNPNETYKLRFLSSNSGANFDFCLYTDPSPENDICEEAITVDVEIGSCGTNNYSGNTKVCRSTGVQSCYSGGNTTTIRDLWYEFTVPVGYNSINIDLIANLTGSTITAQLYSGICSNLTILDCQFRLNETHDILRKNLISGSTYYLRIYEPLGSNLLGGFFEFCMYTETLSPPPPNDNCSGAIEVSIELDNCSGMTTASNVSTTDSGLTSCGTVNGGDSWYKFTVPTFAQKVHLSLQASPLVQIGGYLRGQLYSGDCANLSSVTCPILAYPNGVERSFDNLISGDTYFLSFYNAGTIDYYEEFSFCLYSKSVPSNDLCSGAIDLPLNTNSLCSPNSEIGYTESTTDSNEISICGSGTYNGGDVWYRFTVPTGDTSVVTWVEDLGTFYAELYGELYSGICGNLNPVACSQPIEGYKKFDGLIGDSTYYVRIFDHQNNESGEFDIAIISQQSPPANDLCSGVEPINFINNNCSATVQANNLFASDSGSTNPSCSNYQGGDLWYEFTTPAHTTSVDIDLISKDSGMSIIGTLYENNCSTLTKISCLGNISNKNIASLTPGSSYILRLHESANNTLGCFEFCLTANVPELYIVNTSDDNDDGVCDMTHCSLREAVNLSNNDNIDSKILFNIIGSGPHIIFPGSSGTQFPEISEFVIIDGTSQPSWTLGDIIVDGSNSYSNSALNSDLGSSAEVIHLFGLSIRNFDTGVVAPAGSIIGGLNLENKITNNKDGDIMLTYGNSSSTALTEVKHNILGDKLNNYGSSSAIIIEYENVIILNNQISNTSIAIESMILDYCEISGNTINNCGNGILIYAMICNLGYATIFNNTISNITGVGIQVFEGCGDITFNNISNCNSGIEAFPSVMGSYMTLANNTIHANNYGVSLHYSDYMYGMPSPILSYTSSNSLTCNGIGLLTDCADCNSPVITKTTDNTVSGTIVSTAYNTEILIFLVDDSQCPGSSCQGSTLIGGFYISGSGSWTANVNMTLVPGQRITALAHHDFTDYYTGMGGIATSPFSGCHIIQPDVCETAKVIPVNPGECATTGAVVDMELLTDSGQGLGSSCDITYSGGDAWFKIHSPDSWNSLVRVNINNAINGIVEAYIGTCGNLILEQCIELDSLPHALLLEGYAPDTDIYLRVWDRNNTVVNSGTGALLHFTAHQLDTLQENWEICDLENNLINGNPTILSERDANSFIIEYDDIATLAEIQEIRDSLILGGGSLIDSCLCGSNPLELWDHETPIEMEANKKGARLRARVDTSNYNYLFEQIEFQVNAYADGEQYNADVTMDEEGNFVIIWEDLERRNVFMRVYSSSGNPISKETRVGSQNATQHNAQADIYNNGDFITAWHEYPAGQVGTHFNISARLWNADGTDKGFQFNLSNLSANSSSVDSIKVIAKNGTDVSISSNGTDDFIATWHSANFIFFQKFNQNGGLIDTLQQVAPLMINGNDSNPRISMNTTGDFVIAWNGLDDDGKGIYVQRYNSSLIPIDTAVLVNTITSLDQSGADVTMSDDGSFIVTWHSFEQEGGGLDYGVYAQRYDNTGAPVGSEFQVNTYSTDAQKDPSIAQMQDGTFLIIWSSFGQDGFDEGIYGQFYDGTGSPINTEFRLNNLVDPEQENPSLATNGESIFIGVWEDGINDSDGKGIFGQRYEIIDAGGQKVYYPIGTATPSTLLGDELTYPGTIYNPSDSLASVRVAIIDTGVDPSHPYLSGAIWNNQQVNNGTTCYVNDTLGYDFVNDTPNPIDYDGHGTKVNGIIARDFPADIQLELMNLKFHEFQKGKVFDAVCAIYYAVDNGADIINMSWGFEASEYPAILKKAIQYASDNDVLLITTAGNTSKDNDKLNKFPCNLDIPHMIRVTSYEYKSSTNTKKLANYASYGKNNVDIAAYGFVETPSLGGTLELASGTSLAAPHITRTAAIIKGLFPNLTALDIKDCILNNAAPESDFTDLVSTGGILDHEAAIDCAYEKAANCVAIDLYITIPQSLDTIYRSDVWVETDATVDNNSDVEMWGADHVTMLPGFETTLGTKFLADIDDCDPLNTPVMAQGPYGSETARLRLRENSVLAGKVKVQFYFKGKKVEMNLRQHNGKTIDSYTFQPEKEGWYEKIIDAKLLETGVYELELIDGNNSEIKLFQVQNQHHQQYLNRSKKKTE